MPRDDPATERVAGYLAALAAFEGPEARADRFAALSQDEIALATTLPSASVRQALWRIGGALPPPSAPITSGGGDPTPGVLDGIGGWAVALIAAGILLLVAAAGAVAWCAGSEDCPLRGAVPAPTAAPATSQPTAAPTAVTTPEPTPSDSQEPTEPPIETLIPISYPTEIDFERVTIGLLEPTATPFTILAPTEIVLREPLQPSYAMAEGSDPGFAPGPSCLWTATDSADMSCTTLISFTPFVEGPSVATLLFHIGSENEQRQVALHGEGIAPSLRYTEPFRIVGKEVNVSVTQNFFVDTDISPDLLPLGLEITDDPERIFSLSSDRCDWQTEPDGGFDRCTITVTFTPPEFVSYERTLTVYYGARDPLRIQLVGTWEGFL